MKLGEKIRYLREVEGSLRGLGPAHDAAGTGARHSQEAVKVAGAAKVRAERVHQPVVSVADRKRRAPAHDAVVAGAAGEVF